MPVMESKRVLVVCILIAAALSLLLTWGSGRERVPASNSEGSGSSDALESMEPELSGSGHSGTNRRPEQGHGSPDEERGTRIRVWDIATMQPLPALVEIIKENSSTMLPTGSDVRVPPGLESSTDNLNLRVSAPGYLTRQLPLPLDSPHVVDVALEATTTAKVRFVDLQGDGSEQGVEGVRISARSGVASLGTPRDVGGTALVLTSDKNGEVEIPLLRPAEVRYQGPDGLLVGEFLAVPGKHHRICLRSSRLLEVLFVHQDGAPVVGLDVTVDARASGGPLIARTVRSGADGKVSFPLVSDSFALTLAPGMGSIAIGGADTGVRLVATGTNSYQFALPPAQHGSTLEIVCSTPWIVWTILDENGPVLDGELRYGIEYRQSDGQRVGMQRARTAPVQGGVVRVEGSFLNELTRMSLGRRGCLMLPGYTPITIEGAAGYDDGAEVLFDRAPERDLVVLSESGELLADDFMVFEQEHSVQVHPIAQGALDGSLGVFSWMGGGLSVYRVGTGDLVSVPAEEVSANPVVVATFPGGSGSLRLKGYSESWSPPVAGRFSPAGAGVPLTPMRSGGADFTLDQLIPGWYAFGPRDYVVRKLASGDRTGAARVEDGVETAVHWRGDQAEADLRGTVRIEPGLTDHVRLDPLRSGERQVFFQTAYEGTGLRPEAQGSYSLPEDLPPPDALLVSLEIAGGGLRQPAWLPLAVIPPGGDLLMTAEGWINIALADDAPTPTAAVTLQVPWNHPRGDTDWSRYFHEPDVRMEWAGLGSIRYPVFSRGDLVAPGASEIGMGRMLEVRFLDLGSGVWRAEYR